MLDPQHFQISRLSFESKVEIAKGLDKYVEVMQEVKREDRHIIRNPNSVWRMLSKLGFRHTSDLFQWLKDDDVTEIYDINGRQLYRSFNFFPLCTYSLEQIYSVPWYLLYERDDEMNHLNLKFVERILSSDLRKTEATPIPVHEVRETTTPIRRVTTIQPRFMSPLCDSKGRAAGFLNTFQPLESRSEPSASA